MKIVAKYEKRVINENNETEITFIVSNYRTQELVKELEKNIDYRMDINVVKSRRSIDQNNLLWKLIHDISKKINGELANDNDDWEIYLQALEQAGAKFDYIACLPEGESLLKEQFRAIKLMNTFEMNGKLFNSYKVYHGSSKMDTKEMSLLLETVLNTAAQCGIDTTYYKGGY